MVWVKRLIPLVLLCAIAGGAVVYRQHMVDRNRQQTQRHALSTAKVWFASIRLKDQPETFAVYRDSVLSEAGLSVSQIQEYLRRYTDRPEKYESFARWVAYYVDSLHGLWTGYRPGQTSESDSVAVRK